MNNNRGKKNKSKGRNHQSNDISTKFEQIEQKY